MKITYIHHSSFMAELDHAVLLFDYFEGNIPETDREKPLFVFASHRHGDHFSRSIFDLEESRGNVTYVLSDDIWTRQVPEDLLGRTIFLGPGEEVSLKDGAGNPVDIRAFKSTECGLFGQPGGQDHLPCRGFKQLGMGRGAGGRQPQDE